MSIFNNFLGLYTVHRSNSLHSQNMIWFAIVLIHPLISSALHLNPSDELRNGKFVQKYFINNFSQIFHFQWEMNIFFHIYGT